MTIVKTPSKKAEELFNEYYQKVADSSSPTELAKECALIAINEARKCTLYINQRFENDRFAESYWDEVEQEMKKL